jgi:hypothetical protein
LFVFIGNETDRAVHDWPGTISLAANVQTGQLIEQRWSKDEEDHYRKDKPSPHRVSLKKAPHDRAGSGQANGSSLSSKGSSSLTARPTRSYKHAFGVITQWAFLCELPAAGTLKLVIPDGITILAKRH